VRFRRKSQSDESVGVEETSDETAGMVPDSGGLPHDVDDLPDTTGWVDLGSLLIAGVEGRELRLQVDESTGEVQSVLMAGPDGAVELRAFSAPRNGDLWDEVRPLIAADTSRRGGTATEREGRFGTELDCRMNVQDADGRSGQQPSRVIGINGPRWMLRVTLLGRPAMEPDNAADWEDLSWVAVRRGDHAMPPGDALPLVLPEEARRQGPALD
jgi:hypothetical protein